VFFVQGAEDLLTHASITAPFVNSLQAPRKVLRTVPGAGHDPNFAMIEAQFRLLVDEVLPLTR
jgi:alpha-beta hydrolase superfamily lysophospholipase